MRNLVKKCLLPFAPQLIVLLQRLLILTCRVKVVGEPIMAAHKGKPFILGVWHTNVFLCPCLNRGRGIGVLASASKDGDVISGVIERFGNFAIRGSSSQGGQKALTAMIRHLRRKGAIAITPDGPRGPIYQVKEGIVAAAVLGKAPIIPCHYEASRQWILNSWDEQRIPKPFSRIVMTFGPVLHIPKDTPKEGFPHQAQIVAKALLANKATCEELLSHAKRTQTQPEWVPSSTP